MYGLARMRTKTSARNLLERSDSMLVLRPTSYGLVLLMCNHPHIKSFPQFFGYSIRFLDVLLHVAAMLAGNSFANAPHIVDRSEIRLLVLQ